MEENKEKAGRLAQMYEKMSKTREQGRGDVPKVDVMLVEDIINEAKAYEAKADEKDNKQQALKLYYQAKEVLLGLTLKYNMDQILHDHLVSVYAKIRDLQEAIDEHDKKGVDFTKETVKEKELAAMIKKAEDHEQQGEHSKALKIYEDALLRVQQLPTVGLSETLDETKGNLIAKISELHKYFEGGGRRKSTRKKSTRRKSTRRKSTRRKSTRRKSTRRKSTRRKSKKKKDKK